MKQIHPYFLSFELELGRGNIGIFIVEIFLVYFLEVMKSEEKNVSFINCCTLKTNLARFE